MQAHRHPHIANLPRLPNIFYISSLEINNTSIFFVLFRDNLFFFAFGKSHTLLHRASTLCSVYIGADNQRTISNNTVCVTDQIQCREFFM